MSRQVLTISDDVEDDSPQSAVCCLILCTFLYSASFNASCSQMQQLALSSLLRARSGKLVVAIVQVTRAAARAARQKQSSGTTTSRRAVQGALLRQRVPLAIKAWHTPVECCLWFQQRFTSAKGGQQLCISKDPPRHDKAAIKLGTLSPLEIQGPYRAAVL